MLYHDLSHPDLVCYTSDSTHVVEGTIQIALGPNTSSRIVVHGHFWALYFALVLRTLSEQARLYSRNTAVSYIY